MGVMTHRVSLSCFEIPGGQSWIPDVGSRRAQVPLKIAHPPATRDAEWGVGGRMGQRGDHRSELRGYSWDARRPASPLVAAAPEHTPLDRLLRRISKMEHVPCPKMSTHCVLVQGHGRRIQLSEDAVRAALAPKWRHNAG